MGHDETKWVEGEGSWENSGISGITGPGARLKDCRVWGNGLRVMGSWGHLTSWWVHVRVFGHLGHRKCTEVIGIGRERIELKGKGRYG